MMCYRPVKYGLGDFISITQYCNATGKRYLCYNNAYDRDKFLNILSLFDNNITVTDKCDQVLPVAPHWEYNEKIVYKKAKCLPETKEEDYISISLIPHSYAVPNYKGVGRGLSSDTISKILKFVDAKFIVNLSPCEFKSNKIVSYWRMGIKDKLNLIALSKLHISVDTGIAHLAAMTNTPTIVIAPLVVYDRYAGNSNVHLVSTFQKFKECFHSIVK